MSTGGGAAGTAASGAAGALGGSSGAAGMAVVGGDAGAIGDAGAGGTTPSGPFLTHLDNSAASGRQLTRFDTAGNAIDAHDGKIAFFDGLYYLYGTSYDCGYKWGTANAPFCGFKSYSSTDLVHFEDRGALFDASTATWQTRCNGSTYGCYRPHVVFNASTKKYVLWINVYDNQVGYRVFTSSSPAGPFTEAAEPTLAVNATAPVAGLNNGDHDVFVDDDGVAYVAITDWRMGGAIAIERLDASYLSGTGNVVRTITPGSTEAPALFKRNGVYYLTYSDPNCGYCSDIAGTSYRTAASPLGPWSTGKSISANSCTGQPSFVATIALSTGTGFLYGSDRWNNAAKNEALANFFWAPLAFGADGSVSPLTCQNSVDLSLAVGSAGSQVTVPNLDNDAGVAGFSSYCDIHGAIQRAQTFVATRSGTLSRAAFTSFQDGDANVGLTLAIYTASAALVPTGQPLFTTTLAPSAVGFAPKNLVITPNLSVTAGTRYALVASSAASAGCFGMEYKDDASMPTIGAAYSNDNGQSFKVEAGRTLKFQTTIQ